MYDLIARPLAFFYGLWPSYGGAIVLLTLSIMLVLVPLTLKGTKSMLAMQALQPELKKLQAKYKDDRQKLNEEMLKFYKENNINPMSGCLPLLLQMPVFFFLYRTLLGLTHRSDYGLDVGSAVSRAVQNPKAGVWEQFGNFAPQHLDKSSRLYADLHNTSQMKSFGINLADSASKSLGRGMSTAWPFIVLVLAVAATSYIQQKQVAGRNPQGAQMNPQQAMLLKLMPAFFAFISLGLPAGIVVYFFVSNLFRIGQQAFITRTMYGDNGILHATATEVDKTSTKEPAAKRTGLLERLGVDKESLPSPSRAKATASTGASGKPARGAAAKPPSKATTPPKGTATPPKAARSTTNGRAATPSRKAPATPANRSRNKKKRK